MRALFLVLLTSTWLWAEPFLPEPRLRGELDIPNIWAVKQQLRDYYENGQHEKEVRQVVSAARAYLEENLPRAGSARPAMVLDIDETSLSNYSHIASVDFGYIPQLWTDWVAAAKAPAIEPTLELFRWARSRSISVFFITGRSERERAATERNLRASGYEGWTELYMKPVPNIPNSEFKSKQRQQLLARGYRILVNIGDQMSDLENGYADATFKLPNPMYYVR